MKAKAIMPTMKYKDARKAITWLSENFGFQPHLVVEGPGKSIIHAQLKLGECMVMLGSLELENEYSQLIKMPNDIGGFQTQSPYIVLADEDMKPHYEQVVASGTKIAMQLRSEEHGGQFYACYDLEGHLWNWGSYDPWE